MPENKLIITNFCKISDEKLAKNGDLLFAKDDAYFQQFSEDAYRFLKINYPKFHKMDNLCKLAFLTSENLLSGRNLTAIYDPYRIAVIISNKSSSLDTDTKYSEMLKKGMASPAVFVYSLPSIMLGEICIRNNIKGENTFFISGQFDIASQVQYVTQLFENDVIDACICGWVELMGENYESCLLLVENSNSSAQAYTLENTTKIYSDLING